MNNMEFIGINDKGLAVYVDRLVIAQKGLKSILRQFGMEKSFPVKTSPSGNNVVMVEADTHEQAVEKYLKCLSQPKGDM